MVRPQGGRFPLSLTVLLIAWIIVTAPHAVLAQTQVPPATRGVNVGPNINMVSGTTWPGRRPLPAAPERAVHRGLLRATPATSWPAPTTTGRSTSRPAVRQEDAAMPGSASSSPTTAARPGRARCMPGYPQDVSPAGARLAARGLHGRGRPDGARRPGRYVLLQRHCVQAQRQRAEQVFVSRFIDNNVDTTPRASRSIPSPTSGRA